MNEPFARASAVARVQLAHEPDFSLGGIEVRPARREVVGGNWRQSLDPRVMRVLVALARAKGEILSREDLLESCWDGVIVGDDAITQCISRLRKVLEPVGNTISIATIPRVGYRLIVKEATPPYEPAVAPITQEHAAPPLDRAAASRPAASRRRLQLVFGAVAVLLLSITAVAGWRFWPRTPEMAVEPEASVAVLPFANLSGDPKQEYFGDGFSEQLLNDLSSDPHLLVVARTSAFAFKGRNGDIRSIASTLHVRNVVEGSVREVGNHVRIVARLIDATNGYRIWSASYDRNLVDILLVQDDVARAITVALTHKLEPPAGRPLRRIKINPDAYRLYLKARERLATGSADGVRIAISMLKQVTAMQRNFADGFSGIARSLLWISPYETLDQRRVDVAQARLASQRALSLDPRNIEAREMSVQLNLLAWNWRGATSDVRTLRAENANSPDALDGLYYYYYFMGFPDEAIATWRRAIRLNPLSDYEKLRGLDNLNRETHFEEAIQVSREILAHQPNRPDVLVRLCIAYAWSGRIEQARGTEARLRDQSTSSASLLPLQRADVVCNFHIELTAGNLGGARANIEKLKGDVPTEPAASIGSWYTLVGDFDGASDWYERSYDRRELALFKDVYWPLGAKYHALSARWKKLTQQPLFQEWQAEHDRIAAELKAHRGLF